MKDLSAGDEVGGLSAPTLERQGDAESRDDLHFREMLLSAVEEYAHDLQEQVAEGYFDGAARSLALSVITTLRGELRSGDCGSCDGLGYLALDDEAAAKLPHGSYETCSTCKGTGGGHRWM